MSDEKQLVEEGGRPLAPLEEEQEQDFTMPIILFFGGSVPLVALTQALGLGMPGFVIGAVGAGILAATGGRWFRRIPGLFPGLERYSHLDWTVLLKSLDGEGNVVDADPVPDRGQPKDEPHNQEPQADEPTSAQDEQASELVASSEAIEFARRQTYEVPGVRRVTIDEIVKHTERNSYRTYIGRSLTAERNPTVPISFYRRHIKLIGASQKGKSSMAAALLDIITQTHDEQHVLVALLDKEDQTSKLFADVPHLCEILVGDKPVLMHARNADEVLTCLEHIVGLLNDRYTLSKQEIALEPILIVYLEEFLSLKDDFKVRIDALIGAAKEQAKRDYARLVFCIKEIARRGLKVGIQLLMCAQVDYRDEDLQEALINVTSGLCFCVRATTAQAAGFYQSELLNRNAKENKAGQAVAEMPDVRDLILAPEYNLEQRLITWEKAEAARNPLPTTGKVRQSPASAAGTHRQQKAFSSPETPVYKAHPDGNADGPENTPVYTAVNGATGQSEVIAPERPMRLHSPVNASEIELSEAEEDGNAGDGNGVRAEIREIIKRLDDEKISHRKIAKVVRLDGRKYPIYQQVCREMGIAIEREA